MQELQSTIGPSTVNGGMKSLKARKLAIDAPFTQMGDSCTAGKVQKYLYMEARSIRKLSWLPLEVPERSSGASKLHSMRNSSASNSSSQASVASGKPG